MSAPVTPGPWALNRMDSAVEFAALKGETLAEHEGYYRTNSGAWIVTASETDEEGYQVGGPICEVSFKGKAKRGEAYRVPDPEGQANARLIAAAPEMYEQLSGVVNFLKRAVERGLFTLDGEMLADAIADRAAMTLAKASPQQEVPA